MQVTEAIAILSSLLGAFPVRAESVLPEVLQQLLEEKLRGGPIPTTAAGQKLVNKLLPGGCSLSTCLYEGVVGELPAPLFGGWKVGEEPVQASGINALKNDLRQSREISRGDAVAAEQSAEALQGIHRDSEAAIYEEATTK